MSQLSTLTASALVSLYNVAVDDFAPEGFDAVTGFKNKATAIERIERMCEAGSLAVTFNGDTAVIIDAMEAPEADMHGDDDVTGDAEALTIADLDGTGEVIEQSDEDAYGTDDADGEGEADDADYGDGKGEVAASGFRRASGDWLKANARGSAEREEYRKARRKAARMARKAGRAAKEAALNEAASA